MTRASEQQYLNAILEGDPQALRKLYDKYLPGIVRYVQKNSGTEEEAYDVFQEAILAIFKKARRDGLELTASFNTYLYAICKRIWLQKLKKAKRSGVTFSGDEVYMDTESDPINDILEEEERYRLYREKFRALSDSCQQVMALFFRKVPMEEIANTMGFASVGYAKKRKHQCKEKLISLISDDERYKELL